jgi:hypothetical protein
MSSVESNLFLLFFTDKFVLLYNARPGLDNKFQECFKLRNSRSILTKESWLKIVQGG